MKWLAFAIGIIFAVVTPAMAQTYPGRPIRLVSPYAPGGGTDIWARIIGPRLSESLGQSVVVDNRPGAGGTVGTEMVARSRPDGYTLLLGSPGPLTVSPSLRSLPYNTLRDLAPIALISQVADVLAVHPSLPVKSVRELIAFAKTHREKLTFSSSGAGGSSHLSGALFNVMAGVDMLHVPYRGTGPAVAALVSGEVTLAFANALTILPYVNSGRLRGIAVTSVTRVSAVPDLPTVAEAGVPGYRSGVWYGVLAPAGTSKEIINQLNQALTKIARLPALREQFALQGAELVGSSPEQFAEHIKSETARWAKTIREANITAN